VPDWGMWDMSIREEVDCLDFMWNGIEVKRCCGYKGHWECADDYPDRMVPVSEFSDSPSRHDGYQPRCNRCNRYVQNQQPFHPDTGQTKRGWKEQRAVKLGGDRKNRKTSEWKSYLDGAEVQWNIEIKNHLPNPAQEVIGFLFPETKPSVTTQRTINQKSRNHTMYTMLKELYNYTCQVEDCNETEVSLAHIYKHSLPDSVDDETNLWCLCNNHHSAYDGNRLVFYPLPNPYGIQPYRNFIRYDRNGTKVEIGRIIYDEKHTIDIKWITKAREWHDREK